jgi:hypothetical protein
MSETLGKTSGVPFDGTQHTHTRSETLGKTYTLNDSYFPFKEE